MWFSPHNITIICLQCFTLKNALRKGDGHNQPRGSNWLTSQMLSYFSFDFFHPHIRGRNANELLDDGLMRKGIERKDFPKKNDACSLLFSDFRLAYLNNLAIVKL